MAITYFIYKQVFPEESSLLNNCLFTVFCKEVFKCSRGIFKMFQVGRLSSNGKIYMILKVNLYLITCITYLKVVTYTTGR